MLSNKNNLDSSSTTTTHRQRSDSNPEPVPSASSSATSNATGKRTDTLHRRFSASKMLAKAKDTTKSLVHEVLEKRHSLDSKRSMDDNSSSTMERPNMIPNQSTVEDYNNNNSLKSLSLTSLEKLKMPSSVSSSTDKWMNENDRKILSSRPKHYSLPIRRPFTIKKDKSNDINSSLSSFSSSSSTSPMDLHVATPAPPPPLNAAAVAEAEILAGSDRPGSFATACDFRLANEKRNEEFHALFKSVQDGDMLIQDYKCALQKDILLQGHLYVSEHHVCFKSNIFGWVTNLVISFDEITDLEKRMTAKIIPNGITITTDTSKHVFASFLSRDQAYDQIEKIWDLSKRAKSVLPSAATTAYDHDALLYDNESDGDSIPSNDSAIHLNSPPLLLDDSHDEHLLLEPVNNTILPSKTTSSSSTTQPGTTHSTLAKGVYVADTLSDFNGRTSNNSNRPRAVSDSYKEQRRAVAVAMSSEPKYEFDSKREIPHQSDGTVTPIKKTRVCPCTVKGEQYLHIALNETYTGSVEGMFKLLFDSNFIKKFLERYENFEDVQVGSWNHGAREVIGKRKIKSSTMGTRLVKTLFQEKRIHRKYPYYCCVTAKKSMPDMPMGAVYSIQSRTCITRVSKDKVHVLVTFQVAFSKSGLVSSIIEKNAADDQRRQYSRLHSILNKPDLLVDLVDNPQILEDLHIKTASLSQKKQNQVSGNWVSQAMAFIPSIRLSNIIYVAVFLVLLTHCLLAFRLKRITQHLEVVQQQKESHHSQHDNIRDTLWLNQRIDHVQQRLAKLKGEALDFDKRILKMKNVE